MPLVTQTIRPSPEATAAERVGLAPSYLGLSKAYIRSPLRRRDHDTQGGRTGRHPLIECRQNNTQPPRDRDVDSIWRAKRNIETPNKARRHRDVAGAVSMGRANVRVHWSRLSNAALASTSVSSPVRTRRAMTDATSAAA